MAQKNKIAGVFNKLLTEFTEQVINAFPSLKGDKEILKLKSTLRVTVQNVPLVPIRLFHQQIIIPYETKIVNKDEQFFLSFDLSGTPIEGLNYLKDIYSHATNENKKVIWGYITKLRLLSKKFSE